MRRKLLVTSTNKKARLPFAEKTKINYYQNDVRSMTGKVEKRRTANDAKHISPSVAAMELAQVLMISQLEEATG